MNDELDKILNFFNFIYNSGAFTQSQQGKKRQKVL